MKFTTLFISSGDRSMFRDSIVCLRQSARRLVKGFKPTLVVLTTLLLSGTVVAENALKPNATTIQVVDVNGDPIADADVHVTHWITLKRGAKVYRLIQELSPAAITDTKGVAKLSPAQDDWRDGKITVSKDEVDEQAQHRVSVKTARADFKPGDKLIRLVAQSPVRYSGRLLVDGRPAEHVEICLTEELPGKKFFGRRVGMFLARTDKLGRFETTGYHGETYAFEAMRRLGDKTEHFYHQSPAEKGQDGNWSFGDIEVRSEQFLDQTGLLDLHRKLYPEDDDTASKRSTQ